jgi:predicted enzyme related to lactoylglutathione lyase
VPEIDAIDLIVGDVGRAAAFFRDAVGLVPRHVGERFAEFSAGSLTVMLSHEALVATKPAAGVILHVRVLDVGGALTSARQRGADVLLEPTRTEWGTESAMIAGPDGIVVEFYRSIA